MRLLFVTASLSPGGAERHAVTLMNRLAERGHEVHAVYLKDEQPSLVDRLRTLPGGSARCMNATSYLDRRALADLTGHLARLRPAVIVAANPYALMYAFIARRRAGVGSALVVTYHSTRLLDPKERLQMLAYRLFFWAADCLVFVCEKQRSYWLRRGVFSRRTGVIYNGVDLEEYRNHYSAGEREALRAGFGFAETDYVVGISAWLRPEKNHVQLVDAIARLREQGIPARALMIGDGETRPAVEARARSLGIDSHVIVTGFQADVRPCIAACDTMVLCSLTETFSLAAIEAMALSKPVVHPDVGGAAEMIRSGQEGYLFPVGDTQILAERLAMLADRKFASSMGARARECVEARFSERTMVDRYEDLLGTMSAEEGS